MPRKPTIKQKTSFDKTLGNGGNVTKAMREVGYSENTLNTPQKLTESDGWKQLMDEHISETKLAKVHSEGLEATKQEKALTITEEEGGEVKMGLVEVPDHAVRHKYLETGYKIRGKLNKDNDGNTFNIAVIMGKYFDD